MLLDLLFHRKTMQLLVAKPAGSSWSAEEQRDDPKASFVLRREVSLTETELNDMYPKPTENEMPAEDATLLEE